MSPLRPGYVDGGYSVHRFAVPPSLADRRFTHIRLNSHPDGGIARMRVWGIVARDFDRELAYEAVGAIDLLSTLNGARALGCSNKHYGEPRNLLRPEPGANMGEGWETARNPHRPHVLETDAATGFVKMPGVREWCVLRLAAVASQLEELVVDTHHFRGNFPESVLIEACNAPAAPSSALLDGYDASPLEWKQLLPRTRLGPDQEHRFSGAELTQLGAISHVRVSIFPDGGLMRVRAIGRAAAPMPNEGLEAVGQ
uniref:Allantoicase domain-containing protein n=1 Tax=Coccolithus braarudii TaxID=221442 RepID=A0A7S0LN64_9EUKA